MLSENTITNINNSLFIAAVDTDGTYFMLIASKVCSETFNFSGIADQRKKCYQKKINMFVYQNTVIQFLHLQRISKSFFYLECTFYVSDKHQQSHNTQIAMLQLHKNCSSCKYSTKTILSMFSNF